MLADAKVATMDKNLAGMRVACLVVEKAVLRGALLAAHWAD